MRNTAMQEHQLRNSHESPDMPEIYRTAIRVSDVAGRDKADHRFTFRSPDEQLRQGKRFAESNGGIHNDVASLHTD